MNRKAVFPTLFALLLAAPICWAVQHQYTAAKIVDVQHKTRQKVDMYLVNTPIGSEVPYFEIVVRQNQTDYTAEYTPLHSEELPAEWAAGADVSVRLEKHALFLKRPDGLETRWTLIKKRPVVDRQP